MRRNAAKSPLYWPGRNAHKAFVNACALLDIGIEWLYPDDEQSYIACNITAQQISERLAGQNGRITAVYITSPDYLGNMQDIAAIARACHESGALLSVDNAHGHILNSCPHRRTLWTLARTYAATPRIKRSAS